MSYFGSSWPVFAVIAGVFALATWKMLRERAPLRCPCCRSLRVDWQGSGTRVVERTIEYRTYRCLDCKEQLVAEFRAPLQRLDDWVPGRAPMRPPAAAVVTKTRADS